MIHLSKEIEKKAKHRDDLQRKVSQLQSTIVELEQTAQQELHTLANESKAAITAVQAKCSSVNVQLAEFHKFLKILCQKLVINVQKARELLKLQEKKRKAQLNDKV